MTIVRVSLVCVSLLGCLVGFDPQIASAQLTSRDDPANPGDAATWAKPADSDPFELFGLTATADKVIPIPLRAIWAGNEAKLIQAHDGHDKLTDGTAAKNYTHLHIWDTDKDDFSGKTGGVANQELNDRYWDKRFGVDYKTMTGEIDGGAIQRTEVGNLRQDCSTYGLTTAGAQGSWKYSLVFADQISVAVTNVCAPVALNKVQAKDLIGYTNGSWGQGVHITVVEAVGTEKPSKLRWKYMSSGIYIHTKSKNEWDTPAYFKEQQFKDDPSKWTDHGDGAGDINSANAGLFRKK